MPQCIQRFDIPADHVRIELIIRFGLKIVFDRVCRDPTIALNANFFDAIWIGSLQRLWLHTRKNKSQQHCKDHHAVLQAREFYYKWWNLDWLAGKLLRQKFVVRRVYSLFSDQGFVIKKIGNSPV